MSTRLLAQLCQIGGAVQRGLLTKEAVARALDLGIKAAEGDPEAIEVQAAYEEANGNPLSPEMEAGVEAKLHRILKAPEAPKTPNPLAPK